MQLVNHIPLALESVEACGHFLTSLVKVELKGVQRGMVYSALREAQLPSHTERFLQSFKELLPSLCTENLLRDIASVGLIRGQFNCVRLCCLSLVVGIYIALITNIFSVTCIRVSDWKV